MQSALECPGGVCAIGAAVNEIVDRVRRIFEESQWADCRQERQGLCVFTQGLREVIRRLPAECLDVGDVTGMAAWLIGLGPQQSPLPFLVTEEEDSQ